MSGPTERRASPAETRSTPSEANAPKNPFATRFVRPDAAIYQFPPGLDAAGLVARLAETSWMGEIVGPHGHGKSTLVAALIPALIAAGRRISALALHDGETRLPVDFIPPNDATGDEACGRQWIVDGYEQLGRRAQNQLRRACQTQGCGLLVTAHRPTGLPRLADVQCDLALAYRVVESLQAGLPAGERSIDAADVRRAFAACSGNLRETLFRLYDLFEQRRPARPTVVISPEH